MRITTGADIDALIAKARLNSRRRLNRNLHLRDDALAHRLYNAVEPDSYIRPHRHLDVDKDETMLLVRGVLAVLEFDDDGRVTASTLLDPGEAADIGAGTWHTVVSLEPGTVFFEVKAGPFLPLSPEEQAPWAPPNDAPGAAAYLLELRKRMTADSEPPLTACVASSPEDSLGMAISIRSLTPGNVAPKLEFLARLRLAVFREFPYLYQGTLDDELPYLQRYDRTSDALVCLALDGERPVGAGTGIPLTAESPTFLDPIVAAGLDPVRIFYIGEILFLPGYRGEGLGSRMLAELESHARRLGYTTLACATVERTQDHPQRPDGYLPIDGFCEKHGFRRRPGLSARLSWPDAGGGLSEKLMAFWLKELTSP